MVQILDGGLATELEQRGFVLDGALWSAELLLTHPEAIAQVHSDYAKAGAAIITTATYQATFEGLATIGLGREAAVKLFGRAVDLALQTGKQVAASVGPYGAFLADGSEYVGAYGLSVNALVDFHRPRFNLLAASPAHYLACETIPSFPEAQALAQLVAQSDKPAWITFTLQDEAHICDGTPLAECAKLLAGIEQVMAIGVNCVRPSLIPAAIQTLQTATTKPIIVYPNSGEQWDAERKCWLDGTTQPIDDYVTDALGWIDLGAAIIGGCCRTTPAHIARLHRALSSS